MANTNTFEGIHFVNPANPLPVATYIKNLFPTLGDAEVEQAARLYASVGRDPGGNKTMTQVNQGIAVYGEGKILLETGGTTARCQELRRVRRV